MSCNCRYDLEAKYGAHFKAQHPDASNVDVTLGNYPLILSDKPYSTAALEFRIEADHPLKKGGTKRKTAKVNMMATYCPFCGQPFNPDFEQTLSALERLQDNVAETVYKLVVEAATKAVTGDANIRGFCMAMGSASFEADIGYEEDGTYYPVWEPVDACELDNEHAKRVAVLLDKFSHLNITGMPAKIEKDGVLIKDW